MSIAKKLMTTGAKGGTYVDDVFSTYLWSPSLSLEAQVNGIDLEGEGGLVWMKSRGGTFSHQLFDTERGVQVSDSNGYALYSDLTNAQAASPWLQGFNSDGFSTKSLNPASLGDMASWTFRKAENFFDVVTYTGDGVAGREISHNLGVEPGMIIVKVVSSPSIGSSDWAVYHRDLGNTQRIHLNLSGSASIGSGFWNNTSPTSTAFTLGTAQDVNKGDGTEYVAYLFAHDDSDESMIKCGSFTTDSSGNATVSLGWEPQFLLRKATSSSDYWNIADTMRGFDAAKTASLYPNTTDQEYVGPTLHVPTADGFEVTATTPSTEYIYMAIRRPNKPAGEFEPEELFSVDVGDGSSVPRWSSGFPVDMALERASSFSDPMRASSRLTGDSYLRTDSTTAEVSNTGLRSFDWQDGWYEYAGAVNDYSWMWRRAPGFFDVVAYEGNTQNGREVPHNLAAVPEMMWVKERNANGYWSVYVDQFGGENGLWLSTTSSLQYEPNWWASTDATDEVFTLGGSHYVNLSGSDYIAYLWASVPGICDIGSYTGTGNNQDIDCGFTNGARFVLIKRTDAAGDWMLFDTLRGISVGDSPKLTLNTTAAQVSGGHIRPYSAGFTVTPNIDASDNSGEYIYMAIA